MGATAFKAFKAQTGNYHILSYRIHIYISLNDTQRDTGLAVGQARKEDLWAKALKDTPKETNRKIEAPGA